MTASRQIYFPGHWLAPLLDQVVYQITPPMEDFEKHRRATLELEQLPYCLGATCYSLLELVTTQNITVAHDLVRSQEAGGIHVLRPYERDRMGFLIDSVLEAARRTQNALLPYINRGKKLTLPTSMNAAMNRLEEQPHLLGAELRDLLLSYWHTDGLSLKHYRDLSQHHALVSSDARTFVSADGHPSIYLVLPNNPECKSLGQLRYEQPYVHAVPYLYEQFFQLVRLTNLVLDHLIDRTQPARALLGQPLKGPISLGSPIQGHRIFTADSVVQALKQRVRGLRDPIGL